MAEIERGLAAEAERSVAAEAERLNREALWAETDAGLADPERRVRDYADDEIPF